MNQKCAKRIRIAARSSGRSYKDLKREYKVLPYHLRKYLAGKLPNEPHSAVLKNIHEVCNHPAKGRAHPASDWIAAK